MPFKSEKQRRYLWANEPEIARDWTETYGSKIKKADGGIMRVPFQGGGGMDASQPDFSPPSATLTSPDRSPREQRITQQYDPIMQPPQQMGASRKFKEPYDLRTLPGQLDNLNAGIQLIRFAKDPSMAAFMKWMGGPFGLILGASQMKNIYDDDEEQTSYNMGGLASLWPR